MMPQGPKGAAVNNSAQHLASTGAPRPRHLSARTCWAAQAWGVRGLGAGEAVSAATPARLSVWLSIHLFIPLTDWRQGRDGQTQALSSEKPSLNSRRQHQGLNTQRSRTLTLGEACAQAKAQGGPACCGVGWRLGET